MPIVLIVIAWLAVLILMVAICRAASRADLSGPPGEAADRPEIFVRLGPGLVRDAESGPPPEQLVASRAAGLAPQRRLVRGGAAGRARRTGCAPGS